MRKLAIVGRPNVGKSALFNRISKKRIAIVDEAEGVTRDRIYAEAEIFGESFEVIDTGGIDLRSNDSFKGEIRRQAQIALEEADTVVMVVDGRLPPTELDVELARSLLKMDKPLVLAVNKIDEQMHEIHVHQFYQLGITRIQHISAIHGHNIAELLEMAWDDIQLSGEPELPGIRVAIIGRTNVGKSTLINNILHEKRCIVSPIAGTTRDSIDAPVTFKDQDYIFIDTAGIRRKKSEHEVVEKFAAIRTTRAIERSDICLLMLDAREGISTQDKHIAKQIEIAGKGCVILLNKWDLVKDFRMEHAAKGIRDESPFLKHCPIIAISAKDGRNIDKIFAEVNRVYSYLNLRIATPQLNTFMEKAIQLNHPPLMTGKRLRIYYLTQVSQNPPRFALFVNHPTLLTDNYKKYLLNQFRLNFPFSGTPITFHLKPKRTKTRVHHSLGSPARSN